MPPALRGCADSGGARPQPWSCQAGPTSTRAQLPSLATSLPAPPASSCGPPRGPLEAGPGVTRGPSGLPWALPGRRGGGWTGNSGVILVTVLCPDSLPRTPRPHFLVFPGVEDT